MTTITKERIELFIKNPLDNGLTRGEQMELTRIALASLEAEPVAWKVTFTQIDREYNTFTGMYSDKAEVERWVRLHKACNFRADITPLYTAKPVPVTPDGWVPVSERMPEPYEYVLVTDGFDGCEVMRVNTDGYWGPAKSLYPGSITHWMPLPAAPQQEVK
ncbi:TPA: DUF551 domain-containing protein [Escherichia coli]|nr:DUF551 domain-containing protein [Escherichia coli]HAO9175455.1 DUF551 domain-containing protein [Escherichia coli]